MERRGREGMQEEGDGTLLHKQVALLPLVCCTEPGY